MKQKVKNLWFGTQTTRIPWFGDILVFGTMETGYGTYTHDLWEVGYRVSLRKFLGIKYLYFEKP